MEGSGAVFPATGGPHEAEAKPAGHAKGEHKAGVVRKKAAIAATAAAAAAEVDEDEVEESEGEEDDGEDDGGEDRHRKQPRKPTKRMQREAKIACGCKKSCVEHLADLWRPAQTAFSAMDSTRRRDVVKNMLLPLVHIAALGAPAAPGAPLELDPPDASATLATHEAPDDDSVAADNSARVKYSWLGRPVCAKAFASITTLSRTTLQAIVQEVCTSACPDVGAPLHGSLGQKRGATVETTRVRTFIQEFAATHALPSTHLPRPPDTEGLVILSPHITKKLVFNEYIASFPAGTLKEPLPAAAPASGLAEKPVLVRGARRKKLAVQAGPDGVPPDLPVKYNTFVVIWNKHCRHIVTSDKVWISHQ